MDEAEVAALSERALAEQARLGEVFTRAVGTGAEFSAYLRLRDAGRRAALCQRWLARAADPAYGSDREVGRVGSGSLDRPSSSLERFVSTIHGGPGAPGAARAAVTSRLDGWLSGAGVERARLLVSEVTTNAVVHGGAVRGTLIEVAASVLPASVQVAVAHEGELFACRSLRPEPMDSGGRGLYLVETLADGWGVRDGAGLCWVWFELGRDANG